MARKFRERFWLKRDIYSTCPSLTFSVERCILRVADTGASTDGCVGDGCPTGGAAQQQCRLEQHHQGETQVPGQAE